MKNIATIKNIARFVPAIAASLFSLGMGGTHTAMAALPPVAPSAVPVLPTAPLKAAVPSKKVATTVTVAAMAQAAEEAINRLRAENGLAPLHHNDVLTQVAEAYSKRMATEGFFSHTTPDGVQFFDRVSKAGYSYGAIGENISQGQYLPSQNVATAVVKGWMDSPAHRANIVDTNYTETGIGVYYSTDGRYFFTMIFARPL